MKVWLGVIGRACLEFAIILVFISFTAGVSSSLNSSFWNFGAIDKSAAKAALDLVPLAAVFTVFLAFFSFELRVKNRAAGWLGLFLLGAVLLSFGIEIRRLPLVRDALTGPSTMTAKVTGLIPAGTTVQHGSLALWIGSYAGSEARDAVAVDFDSDYPRLSYAPFASIDPSMGDVDIQGRTYRAALPKVPPIALVPEVSLFSGSWIWDRLDSMDHAPLFSVFSVAGGFLLLAIGFRFLCRLSGWPLANAFLAVAGLAGLLSLDAALSGEAVRGTIEGLAKRMDLVLSGPMLLACVEGAIGLALGAAELAAYPRKRRRSNE